MIGLLFARFDNAGADGGRAENDCQDYKSTCPSTATPP
jgi:hypothetical protein